MILILPTHSHLLITRISVVCYVTERTFGFVAYSPLGKGYLTGKMTENTKFDSGDIRNILPRFTSEALGANQA